MGARASPAIATGGEGALAGSSRICPPVDLAPFDCVAASECSGKSVGESASDHAMTGSPVPGALGNGVVVQWETQWVGRSERQWDLGCPVPRLPGSARRRTPLGEGSPRQLLRDEACREQRRPRPSLRESSGAHHRVRCDRCRSPLVRTPRPFGDPARQSLGRWPDLVGNDRRRWAEADGDMREGSDDFRFRWSPSTGWRAGLHRGRSPVVRPLQAMPQRG